MLTNKEKNDSLARVLDTGKTYDDIALFADYQIECNEIYDKLQKRIIEALKK